ncbi:hypothetical protein, partial [Mesorhizobium ciceri]
TKQTARLVRALLFFALVPAFNPSSGAPKQAKPKPQDRKLKSRPRNQIKNSLPGTMPAGRLRSAGLAIDCPGSGARNKAKPKLRNKKTNPVPCKPICTKQTVRQAPASGLFAFGGQWCLQAALVGAQRGLSRQATTTKQASQQNLIQNSPQPRAVCVRGTGSEVPSRRHNRINRIGGEKDEASDPLIGHRSVMPVMTCNQIGNDWVGGGVLFSRLFVATLGHDND